MTCNRLADKLEHYLSGALPEDENCDLEKHLKTCRACSALLEGLVDEMQAEPASGDEFVRDILSQTVPEVCGKVTEFLCDYVDGKLRGENSHLISGHIAHCPHCSALSHELARLNSELPEIGNIEPEPWFTGEVLRETSGKQGVYLTISARMETLWQRLVQRPRFSWEAAYLGVLLLFLVFGGTPAKSIDSLRQFNLASMQLSTTDLLQTGPRLFPAFLLEARETGLESLRTELETGRLSVQRAWTAIKHRSSRAREISDQLITNGRTLIETALRRLQDAWTAAATASSPSEIQEGEQL
jgi:hypothetical protein